MFPFEGEIAITMAVGGPTGVGKTKFSLNLFRFHKEMFPDQEITKFIICYSEWQPAYSEVRTYCPQIQFIHGLISKEELDKCGNDQKYTLMFIDDLLLEISSSSTFLLALMNLSHHKKLNIVYTIHNMYFQGKYSRTLTLNTKYICLFMTRRDINYIQRIANQIIGTSGGKSILEIFHDIRQSNIYGYILIDMSPHGDPRYMLRTNIYPGEDTVVYIMKDYM